MMCAKNILPIFLKNDFREHEKYRNSKLNMLDFLINRGLRDNKHFVVNK